MIDTFFDTYFKDNMVRGIKLYEKNLVIQTFLVLFSLLILCILLFSIQNFGRFLFHYDYYS
ncbi:hypothetical protein SAMN04487975_101383 [Planococcus glaciei]|nr:hypothetical protein SAMN04487975_101383 [Planococcus glaciei]